MGGKSKLARELSNVILSRTTEREFYLEPFVGGASMFSKMAPQFQWSVAGDAHPDLILMWNAVLFEGWEPPTEVSREQYTTLKYSSPSAERGFVGFGGSFGGRWFEGYAKGGFTSTGSPRNHQAESARAVLRIRDSLVNSNIGFFRPWSFEKWSPLPGTVIYCDPPYESTKKYAPDFNSDTFWKTARGWANRGCKVFVSEYEAPEDIDCIWEKSHRQTVSRGDRGDRKMTTERLYFLEGGKS